MDHNSAEKEPAPDPTQEGSPIHRVKSAQLLGSPKEPSLSRSGSAGSLQAKAESSSPRRSAPGSAKSDQLNKRRPLPPIGTSKDDLVGEDEFASVTESELAVDRNITELESSDEDAAEKKHPRKVSPILEDNAESSHVQKCVDMETQTEWSWIETMKTIQQHVQTSKLQALADEAEDGETESQKAGRGSTHSKGSKISKAGTHMSQSSRRKSGAVPPKPEDEIQSKAFLALSPSGISAGSITGPIQDEQPAEILTTLVLPYREDEYGVPALLFSDSDSESDSDETVKPTRNMTKTLPSVGPPQILQYKRDTKKGIITQSEPTAESNVKQTDETDCPGQELITFSGNCEFCNEPIKPFPTLHQQQICPPEELYCCEEFANFVRLAILPPPPNAHLIDIKPHGHYGSKQARAAAKEKAELRIREREVQRARTLQSSRSSGPSSVHPAAAHHTVGGDGRSHGGGAGHHGTNQGGGGGGNMGGTGRPDAGGANMFAYARAMKTINFQLSSQKCIDEGYVIRPPSPLREEEYISEPFSIEPVEWCHVKLNDDEEENDETYSYVDEDGNYVQFTKPRPKRACVERLYPDGEKFLTMFPDGTGNVFYPNRQLAISVSSVEPGKFTYLVYDVQKDDKKQQELLAEFEPDAKAACYHRGGVIRLYLDQLGGIELSPSGHKKKKWHWLADQDTQHIHAPPVQPLCFALNRYIGLRVANQDNIAMTFLGCQRSCRFNVGVKLKLVHPENLPVHLQYDDDELFMKEKSNRISGLIDKIESLLKFPHSSKAEKIPVPKRVTIKAERIERQRAQAHIARQKDKQRRTKKFSRPLPNESSDFEQVLLTEPDLQHTQRDSRGRPPKHPAVVVN